MKLESSKIELIRKYFETRPVLRAYLFGSFARSEADSESDIDILVNFIPGTKITLFMYAHIVNDLQKLTGKKVDLVESGQLELYAQNSAEKDKILIYERKAQG